MTIPASSIWRTIALIGAMALAPAVIWLRQVGDPSVYFTSSLPPGQTLFAFAKLCGLLAIVLFWVQALLGMAPRVRALRVLPQLSRRAHIWLGIATALMIFAHVGLFVVATSFRKNTIALDLLLPNFNHGYYFLCITLGAFAFYLLIIVLFAGWRLKGGSRSWKFIHMLWAAMFALVLLHSLGIGSESRSGPMGYLFFFIAGSLSVVALTRLLVWWRKKNANRSLQRDTLVGK